MSSSQLLNHTSGFSYDVFEPDLMEWSHSVGRTAHSFCGSFVGACNADEKKNVFNNS